MDASEDGEHYYVTDDESLSRKIKKATCQLKVLPDTADDSRWDDCDLWLQFLSKGGRNYMIRLNGDRITVQKGQGKIYYELKNLDEFLDLMDEFQANGGIEDYDF